MRMNEIKKIIKKLEDIFPTINLMSSHAAQILMSVIKELAEIPEEKQVTLNTVIKAVENDPQLLADVLKEVGADVLFHTLMNVKNMTDDIGVLSRSIPSLDTYPLKVLKELEQKLERNKDDPENRFMLDGLQTHLRRREGRNPDEFS